MQPQKDFNPLCYPTGVVTSIETILIRYKKWNIKKHHSFEMDIDRSSKAEVAVPQEKIGSFDLLPFPFYHLMGTPARVITLFELQCTLSKSSPNPYQVKQGILSAMES